MDPIKRRWLTVGLTLALLSGVLATRSLGEPENDFHFSILGDRTGGAAPQIFGRVWREVDLLHPDFVITVGDTIQGRKDELAEEQWRELRPLFERYKHYPVYFTPGNHDVWSEFSERLYEKETGRSVSYSFDYQRAHFTVLDNSRETEMSEEQLEFLDRDLAANRAKQPKFVFFHKPFWVSAFRRNIDDFPLHELVQKHKVDYVITGHGHQFVRMVRDGVAYIEVGSSGGTMIKGWTRGQGFPDGRFYHHLWGRVHGAEAQFTVKEIGGAFGRGRMFPAEDWDENGPKFNSGDPALTYKPET